MNDDNQHEDSEVKCQMVNVTYFMTLTVIVDG